MALSGACFIDICTGPLRLSRAGFAAYGLVDVLAVDAAAEQGRQRGPLSATGPQRVGPGREAVAGAGRLQLRPGEPATREALERLVASVTRHLEPGKARAIAAEGLQFAESRPLGGTHVLDALWQRLGIGPAMRGLLKGRRLDPGAERVLFALAANRALAPSSKLAAARWASEDVLIAGLPATTDDACYRAMDWLLQIREQLEKQVFDRASEVLGLEVDLLFFDTTSTYFVTEEADAPVARDQQGNPVPEAPGSTQRPGDGVPDLGQVQGPPRRPAPGRDRHGRHPGRHPAARVVLAREHRRLGADPPGQGRHAATGPCPGSSGSPTAGSPPRRTAATCARREPLHHRRAAPLRLRRGGRRPVPAGPLPGSRGEPAGQGSADRRGRAVRHLPQPRGRRAGAAIRARLIAQLKELIDGTDALGKDKRAELRGVISTKPGLNRYLRVTPGGLLRVDAAKAKAEENLDGKYLLRTSDPKMTAEDIALGYRQLLEVERGWRDMKQVIDLRPVYHRKEERIRAHVILCWLALLLARIAENACGDTWPELRRQLDRIAVGTFTGPPAPPPAHRDQPSPGRHPRTARHRPATEDLPAHPAATR